MNKLLSVLFIFILAGCGGGGGGGGDSSGSQNRNLVNRGVRVLHGSIDAPPLDIFTDTSIGKVSFGVQSFWKSLSTGDTLIQLKRSNTEEVLFSAPASISGDQRVTLVLSGNNSSSNAQVSVIKDNVEKLSEDFAYIRCINAVEGLRAVECSFSGGKGEIVSIGAASSFSRVAPGPVAFSVTSKLGGVSSGAVTLEAGQPYSLFVSGEYGYFIKDSLELG